MRGRDERPEIFGHHDCRTFLRDWLAYLKATQRISLRSLAKRAGLAAGTLPMFLGGKRKLGAESLEKLLPHLGLGASEGSYLQILRQLDEARSPDDRARALWKLQRFGGYRSGSPSELEVARYLSHWYYVAIREMAIWPGFRPTAEWILPRLRHPVSAARIETALAFLFDHGFIERAAGGRVSVAVKPLQCDSGVFRLSLANFHHEMLELATKSISSVPREQRLVVGHTTSLPPERFAEAQAILSRALREIEALSPRAPETGTVYHFGLSAIPLTDEPGESLSGK